MADGNDFQSTTTRERVQALLDSDKRLTQTQVAREVGISGGALNQWLKGVYAGDNAGVDAKVLRWLDAFERERMGLDTLPAAPGYVATPTSERVLGTLRYAQMAGDFVIVYGGAGVGKTQACKRYASIAPNVWHVEMTPSTSGLVPCLEAFAEVMGIRGGGGAAKHKREIYKRVRNTHGLIIVDEANHLAPGTLEEIRGIHDATGIGVALVGNEETYTRIASGARAAYLDRVNSRLGKKTPVKRATADDVDALLGAWKFGDAGCKKLCHEIAKRPGALRGLTKTLQLASMYAHAEKRALCCEDIQAAWRELGGAE
jgi:hypothetical protein